MKKFVVLVLILAAATGFYKFYKAEKTRVLRVGIECDYAPNNWEDAKENKANMPIINNKGFYADGYDVQIAKKVADDLNANLEVYKIAWQDLISALNEGRIDAIFSGMLDTEERKEKIAFSDTYEARKTEYTIVVNINSKYAGVKKLSDLSGAKILAQRDSNLDTVIDQIPGVVHVNPVETVAEIIDKLESLEVDGSVMNVDTGMSYEKTHRSLHVIRFEENEGFRPNFNGVCAGVRKGDTKLLEEINDSIHSISQRERLKIMDQTISRLWRSL